MESSSKSNTQQIETGFAKENMMHSTKEKNLGSICGASMDGFDAESQTPSNA